MFKKLTNLSLIVAVPFLCFGQYAQGADAPANQSKKPVDLPNFHQVHSFLYRGGEPTAEGVNQLKALGVKTIIDLRNPGEKKFDEAALAKNLGLDYIAMPMNSAAPTRKQVTTMTDSLKQAQDTQAGGSVFVHCAHGSDRTGCMIGIWRVTADKWSYDEAYKEMRKYWFTPKFTKLSGAVKKYAAKSS